MSRALGLISDLLWLFRFGGILLTVTAANAGELYKLEQVIGKPLKAAIEEFPGGRLTSLLAQLRRSEIFIDTMPKKHAQLR